MTDFGGLGIGSLDWDWTPGDSPAGLSGCAAWWSAAASQDYAYGVSPSVQSLTDLSGNGNTMSQSTAAAQASYGPVVALGSLAFDGTDDTYLSNGPALSTGSFTISGWVYPTALPATGYVSRFVTSQLDAQWIGFDSNGHPTGLTYLGGTNQSVTDTSTTLTLNTWYHLALTCDGVSLKLYVNGVNTATLAVSGGAAFYTGVRLGAQWSGVSPFLSGSATEISVFTRPLSASEVTTLYNSVGPLFPVQSGLLRLYPPNAGIGYGVSPSVQSFIDGMGTGNNLAQNTSADQPSLDSSVSGYPALSWDGTDDYMTASDAGLPAGDAARTIFCWFKTSATSGTYRFLVCYGTSGVANEAVGLSCDCSLSNYAAAIFDWGYTAYGSTLNLNDGNWHSICWTYAGNGASTLYVDAVAQTLGGNTLPNPLATTLAGANGLVLGARVDLGAGTQFSGETGLLAIANRAWSAAEVQSAHNFGGA